MRLVGVGVEWWGAPGQRAEDHMWLGSSHGRFDYGSGHRARLGLARPCDEIKPVFFAFLWMAISGTFFPEISAKIHVQNLRFPVPPARRKKIFPGVRIPQEGGMNPPSPLRKPMVT